MDFFFQAHDSFMRGFVEMPKPCAFCGQRGPAFNLEEAAPAAGETLPGPRDWSDLWRRGTKKPPWGSGVVHTFECVLCGERGAYFDST